MTENLWHFLSTAAPDASVATDGTRVATAGSVRAAALSVAARLGAGEGPVMLYCGDAANFVAGLAGALIAEREVLLPGHAAPDYLREIGVANGAFVSDIRGADAIQVSVYETGPGPGIFPSSLEGRVGFFTSGSSGEPKLCMKAMDQLAAEVAVLRRQWGAPQGAVAGTVSHQHIYGLLFRVLWPLATGAIIFSQQLETWEAVAARLEPGGVIVSSPAHLARIPSAVRLPHMPTAIFSSGGPLSLDAAENAAAQFGFTPIEVLGSTETGGVAWRRQTGANMPWTPMPEVEIRADETGALVVRSPFTGHDGFLSMGDAVEIADDGRFTLRGRLDRIVKIEGKRVSLPRVEEALKSLAGIADAAAIDLPARQGALGAVVVPTEEGETALATIGPFRFSRHLRSLLKSRLEPMEQPRFWRFVPRIPENAQGKRIAADLRALFSSPELPQIDTSEIDGDDARFELRLQPELRWFEGHFPGQPILPGVAQLHIAAVLAEQTWGTVFDGREMSRIKFKRVMQPEERVSLTLRKDRSRLDFKYICDGDVVASGTVRSSS
ncbi:AMP-binding protein [Parvibaculum sp.]|uniref:AMP-binding protein n=1 Tax=Parvibaculum sp. TaxID=2024848 RepID=UPI002732106D|nr:AMP-binding protein [Parvibaculum sp.]MDP1627321.1 AMP-binding protein [Parvibaculum sp.]MDP2151976.1 AMP-binding protein [Parvibaculum sp.]MDP3329083.1 AMP-binding protein [Parvibaculum sp.]